MVTVASTEELRESFLSFSKNAATLKFFISVHVHAHAHTLPAHAHTLPAAPGCPFFRRRETIAGIPDRSEGCHGPFAHMQKFRQLHALAIQHMENKDFHAARECFKDQLQYGKNEWHKRVPHYNIACCESLLGNNDSACEFLQKAIQNGFRNCRKLKTDPDLDNLREKSPETFQNLLEELKKEKLSRGCWRHQDSENPETNNNNEINFSNFKCCHRNSESEDVTGCEMKFAGRCHWRHQSEGVINTHGWGGHKYWNHKKCEKRKEQEPTPSDHHEP